MELPMQKTTTRTRSAKNTGMAEAPLLFALPDRLPAAEAVRLWDRSLAESARSQPLDQMDDTSLLALALRHTGGAATAGLLLKEFGTLAKAMAASEGEATARAGIDREGFLDLRIARELAARLSRTSIETQPVLTRFDAVVDYLRLRMAEETRERFVVLFLDHKNRLIRDEVMSEGTIDHCPVYPRQIMRRALELSAANIILSHQHPSGDPAPSQADIAMTKKIKEAAKALDIKVHDHIIIGRTGYVSLTMKGLM